MFPCVDGKEGKMGRWGPGKGVKKWAVDSEHGSARAEVCFLIQRATIPSKRVIFALVNTTHGFNIIYMLVILCT
jgi:hypothetical protein